MTLPLIAACLVLADCSSNNSSSTGPTTAFAVMRLTTADGSPDTSFGGGRGIVTTDLDPGLFDFALAAAVQPLDNKILVGGSSGLAGSGVIALVRYNVDGSLDTTFNGTGVVRTTLAGVAAGASAIAVQPNGQILVAALTFTASNNTTGIALLRYNTNGSLDTAGFGAGNGFVTATIGQGLATDTCALALQGDGRIVVAGATQTGDIVLYRYNANGTLDTAGFGVGTGKTTTNLGAGTAAMSPALALQSTGQIIVVSGTSLDQVVLRYGADGVLDTTFGGAPGGIVTTDIGGSTNFANAVAVQSIGNVANKDKIIVAGHANVNFNADASDISLVRYNADGTLDTTFGAGGTGIVTTNFGAFDNVFSVALQDQSPADPKILLSGNSGSGGISQMAVLRYNYDGTPDTTFGPVHDGVVIVALIGPSNIASGNAVVLQPVGTGVGIIVAGYD
jgi:uncharacterized delta-60 repeat protein